MVFLNSCLRNFAADIPPREAAALCSFRCPARVALIFAASGCKIFGLSELWLASLVLAAYDFR
jgi:hypothetical protein